MKDIKKNKKADPAAEAAEEVKEETAKAAEAEAEDAAAEEAAAEPAEDAAGEPAAGREEDGSDNLAKELQESQDRYLRLMAEYDNFRKRTAKEKEGIYADATVTAYSGLLPVLDNFERAFESPDASPEDFRKGVEMTQKQLLDVFEKAGVEPFGKPGDPFDPTIHNAVMHVDDDQYGDNEIVEVFQKGYKLGDRILRHAMVKVAN